MKAQNLKAELKSKVKEINGISFLAEQVDLDPASIKDISFQLRKELSPLFMVLASSQNKKATLSVALSDELVVEKGLNSSSIVKELSSFIQGGGGGQTFFATAGGKNVDGIPAALKHAEKMLSISGSIPLCSLHCSHLTGLFAIRRTNVYGLVRQSHIEDVESIKYDN